MTVGELTRKTTTYVNTILLTIACEDYFAANNYRIMRYADILMNYAELLFVKQVLILPMLPCLWIRYKSSRSGQVEKDGQWKDCR